MYEKARGSRNCHHIPLPSSGLNSCTYIKKKPFKHSNFTLKQASKSKVKKGKYHSPKFLIKLIRSLTSNTTSVKFLSSYLPKRRDIKPLTTPVTNITQPKK